MCTRWVYYEFNRGMNSIGVKEEGFADDLNIYFWVFRIVYISFLSLIISEICVQITIGAIVAGNRTYGK